MNNVMPWCILCKLPHSLDYCVVARSFVVKKNIHNQEEEEEKSHDDASYNMVCMFDGYKKIDLEEYGNEIANQRDVYQLHHQKIFSDDENYDEDKVCVTFSVIDHVNLRMPSKEEIDRITIEMIYQVHINYSLRNGKVNDDARKSFGIFIKDITHKMKDESKKDNL